MNTMERDSISLANSIYIKEELIIDGMCHVNICLPHNLFWLVTL